MIFTSKTPYQVALTTFLNCVRPISDTENASIRNAVGRVLAHPITSDKDVPNYRRAAMDGYAVRAEDTIGANARSPVILSIVGEKVEPATAKRVHTGSRMPNGADAVVMVEDTELLGGVIEVRAQVHPFKNVGPKGEDVQIGAVVLNEGHRLRPADIGLLASLEVDIVEVYRKPEVAIIPTGEELVTNRPAQGEIVETNGIMNSLLVAQWGANFRYRNIVTDTSELIENAILRDSDADLIITTGGTSVGIRDLVPTVVKKIGKVLIHGIAISPGMPTALGVISKNKTPIACLPGFPVACLVASTAFVKPAIYRLGHISKSIERTVRAKLERKIVGKTGSRTYARVALNDDTAVPIMISGSGILSSIAKADGFVIIPENVEGYNKGEWVEVVLFD
ncbi:MAG TPA: gephyrin-like molybdotransferase Glp [Candidatus Acidoferrales bacterium]|nr:gephyrin-like molybdotransferase Glp [Candidatus Acidoferrales bacterium]